MHLSSPYLAIVIVTDRQVSMGKPLYSWIYDSNSPHRNVVLKTTPSVDSQLYVRDKHSSSHDILEILLRNPWPELVTYPIHKAKPPSNNGIYHTNIGARRGGAPGSHDSTQAQGLRMHLHTQCVSTMLDPLGHVGTVMLYHLSTANLGASTRLYLLRPHW